MTLEKRLESLGLTSQEATIYLTLLQSGELPASQVANQVGLQRTTAYAILKGLVQRGFVLAYLKTGRQVFIAEKPQNLVGHFEQKLKNFTDGIPLFASLEKKQIKTTGVRFIETTTELKRFYGVILREYRGRSYVAMGNTQAWEGLDAEFFTQYRKDRAAVGIHTRLLLSGDSRAVNREERDLGREVKFLPKKYQFKSTIDIFDDKILIVSPEQTSIAVVIAVPAMIDIFKSTFELIWDLID